MKSLFRSTLFAALATLCAVAFTACDDDDTTGGDLQLHYPTVVDIGPSMNFVSGTPTYYGPAPSDFSIDGITLDDAAIETACFTIAPETGAVSIADTEGLQPGVYKLSIACRAGGAAYRFKDIFTVRMVPATPVSVEVSEPLLSIPYTELKTSEASVTVTPVGETVSILAYALVQEEGKEYFAISDKGVVTLNGNFKGEVLPGEYPLPIRIETYAGATVYENLLTGRITSAPLSISYPSAAGRMEYDMAFQSSVPTVKGSPDNVAWAIKQIVPEEGAASTDKIAIDPATGVVSVAAGNGLPVGASYTLDLTVSNDYGSTDFDGAYTLTVIAYIAPIDPATFAYDPVEAIQGGEFTAPKRAGFVGDEPSFSLGELPEALAGKIAIDEATGTISAGKGHTIPVGEYAVPVKVANLKGEAQTTLSLKVVENPYFFTTISYGNNLGLEPAADYASQFRCATAGDFTSLVLTPTTDAKPGTKLTWSIQTKHQCSGTDIDSETGEIKPAGFKANNGGLILVTATAGAGQVGETSVTVPVFFSFMQTVSGVTIHYTPFVFQVNPRRGGTPAAPTVEGVAPAQFLMDYRRTFSYYNIAGPASHGSGALSASNNANLLGDVWRSYFSSIGSATANYGSKDPLSYYSNSSRLSSAMLYVDATTKSVVVNANKWIGSDNVAANGAFIGQMTFVTNGNQGGINSGSQVFPIWVWFDEKF